MLSVILYLFRLDSILTSTILLYQNLVVRRLIDTLFAFVEQTSQDVLQLLVPTASCKISLQYWRSCHSSNCHIPSTAMLLHLHVILKVVLTLLLGHGMFFIVSHFLS